MKSMLDAKLEFGSIALSSGTIDFPNTVEIGKSDVSRMAVAFDFLGASGGTSVVLKVQGSKDGTTFQDIAASASIALADMGDSGITTVGLPAKLPDGITELKAVAVLAGTFTAGTAHAAIDTYLGV